MDANNQEMEHLNGIIHNISKWSGSDDNMKKDVNGIIAELNKRNNDITKHI